MADELEEVTQGAEDEKQLSDSKKLEKWTAKRDKHALLYTMSTVSGRRTLYRLLDFAGLFRLSFTGDNNQTNFREGSRNVGLFLLGEMMDTAPELYLKMMSENKETAP